MLYICSEEMPHIVDQSFNISQYEYAFDMAADIEPIPPIDSSAIDYDNLDYNGGNDFDDLAQGMCNRKKKKHSASIHDRFSID